MMLTAALAAPSAGSTFFGVANGPKRILLGAAERERHLQLVGPTRSGKSQLLFALSGQDMRAGLPILFMEAKGDRGDFDQFLRMAERAGRVAAVRYFNPQDSRSMTFNPIRMVPGQDATAIANQIVRAIGREPTSSGEGQDYYRSVDYAKVQNMAEIFCSIGRQFTLRDCFFYFGSEAARNKAFALCAKDRRLVGIATQQFKESPDSTALSSALRPWTTGSLGALLNSYSPQIKLEEVFANGQLAYFAIPIGHLQVLANPLGRMLISGLLSVASSRQRAQKKPQAASVILDEFAEFATPVFASFIATVGSARFWTTLSHQDLGQLKKVQGMDADAFASAVFNNTSGCKVCFRTPDPEDAEFWSSTLGTYATTDDTERFQRGLLGTMGTGEMSRRKVEQFRIHPNRLKNLKPGTALIFAPGKEAALVRTARVYALPSTGPVPELAAVETRFEEGLDLEAAVPDPGGAGQYELEGEMPQ
ncbi:MAG: TraM recognition domain-containing protein [Elusimicrobia bacterium]|nr:TraM recognition domain-containing protein [Elusimicrobiota bacterium]